MFAVSLDNLLFLLLIAAAALFQLLSKAITKAGKERFERHIALTDATNAPTNSTRATRIRCRSNS
jgi:hypothetical protein